MNQALASVAGAERGAAPGEPPRRRGAWDRRLAWAQNLLGALLLAGFGRYLWLHRSEFAELIELSAADVAVLVGLMVLTQLLNTAQSWLLLRAAGVCPSFFETLIVNCATIFGNYLPMRAGTLIRAHFLKEVYGLSYARFGSMFGVRTIITLFGTAILGLISTISVWLAGHRLSLELLVGFSLMLGVSAAAWFIPTPTLRIGNGPLGRVLQDLLEGAKELRRHPRAGLRVLSLGIVQQLALVARLYAATRSSTGGVPLSMLLLLSTVATLATYVAVTPGALGLREVAMGGATYAVGTTFSSGVLLGTLDRTLLLVVVAGMGFPSFIYIWVKLRRVDSRKQREPSVKRSSVGI